mmetsp:Transcript_25361/g.82035  ORF Transcript_25361/g.82035 Transcript_25361/m.82035 type:complete len:233 (+) Transcript_25361:284-982(+)
MRSRRASRTALSAPWGVWSAKTPALVAARTLFGSSSARKTLWSSVTPKVFLRRSICAFLSPRTSEPSAQRGRSSSSPNSKRGSKWSAGVETATPWSSLPKRKRRAFSTTSLRPKVAMATWASRPLAASTNVRKASTSTNIASFTGTSFSGAFLNLPQTWYFVSVRSKSKIARNRGCVADDDDDDDPSLGRDDDRAHRNRFIFSGRTEEDEHTSLSTKKRGTPQSTERLAALP